MDQHLLRQKLETFVYLEIVNQHDYFKEISLWVNEYKESYGCDDFIDSFISEYLAQRREYHSNR
jgi:hypothetical protein